MVHHVPHPHPPLAHTMLFDDVTKSRQVVGNIVGCRANDVGLYLNFPLWQSGVDVIDDLVKRDGIVVSAIVTTTGFR